MQLQLTEIRVAGFGGQGVILSAIVMGKAASIFKVRFATMTQNFGPEARGGACSAQLHPLRLADPLSVRDAARHSGRDVAGSLHPLRARIERRRNLDRGARSGARHRPAAQTKVYSVSRHAPGRRTGQAHGPELVMVGFFTAVTRLLEPDAVRKAVADSVPASFRI